MRIKNMIPDKPTALSILVVAVVAAVISGWQNSFWSIRNFKVICERFDYGECMKFQINNSGYFWVIFYVSMATIVLMTIRLLWKDGDMKKKAKKGRK